jgi:phage FluMu protein Com
MSGDKADDVKVRCPKCNAEVRVDAKAQAAMFVMCPNGHKVELMKMID